MARIVGHIPVYSNSPGIVETVVDASSSVFNDLLDVTLTNPTNGQAVIYSNGLWVNGSAGGSGTNPPTGAAGGELAGTYPNPTVAATHSGSSHATAISTAESFATAAIATHAATQHGDTVLRLFVPASAMWSTTTSGCTGPLLLETTTSKSNRIVLGFITGVTRRAEFEYEMPDNWNFGTLTATFDWSTDAGTSETCRWQLQAYAIGDGDDEDQPQGTARQIDDANGGTAYVFRRSATTAALTVANTPSATRRTVHFRVSRVGASDTLTGTAYLRGIYLTGTHT